MNERPSETQVALKGVHIVGFAPSWEDTPWDDPTSELWGMNALHKAVSPRAVAAEKNWSRWFQLHDLETHHRHDFDEHVSWLKNSGIPVLMWREDAEKYAHLIPNVAYYPRAEVVNYFGRYFTNTVSWMLALAILEGRQNISVFGVDMAQDSEYGFQRPSCEYFIGWARGAGINVHIPDNSDLLKAPFLYGAEDGSVMRMKLDSRLRELTERRQDFMNQHQGLMAQVQQLEVAIQQLNGAVEDVEYWHRAWSLPNQDGKVA